MQEIAVPVHFTFLVMASHKLWLILLLPVLLRLLKSRPLPTRETVIKPRDERVLLLGASSGVGRDLAHAYAKRNARMYVDLAERQDAA